MHRKELIKILEQEGIPSCWYSLYGELLPDRIVLYENYGKWEVFYFALIPQHFDLTLFISS